MICPQLGNDFVLERIVHFQNIISQAVDSLLERLNFELQVDVGLECAGQILMDLDLVQAA